MLERKLAALRSELPRNLCWVATCGRELFYAKSPRKTFVFEAPSGSLRDVRASAVRER